MWSFRKKRPRPDLELNRESALRCVPIRNSEVREDPADGGGVVLVYPVKVKPWLAGISRRLGGGQDGAVQRKVELDELGAWVWGMTGEGRTVRDVVELFVRQHQVLPQEAELAVTTFFRELGRRGLIGFK